jgi:hypothetical protein
MGLDFAVAVARPPVILLGMHRSGTSLIARLLDDLGLFQGKELQEDHESTWFLAMNEHLLRRVNATWDHPQPFSGLLQHDSAVDLAAKCLRDDLSGQPVAGYLGMPRYLKYRSLAKFDVPWAWKDPRTIFTLPLWLRLFPAAKLVYIVRNGVDVAASLQARERKELARRLKEYPAKRKKLAGHPMIERASFKGSARCLDLAGGFGLWEEYVAEAEKNLAAATQEKLVISYEKLIATPADPDHGLGRLAKFCGLRADDNAIKKACAQIDTTRRNAYLGDPELKAFYETVKTSRWMKQYGYETTTNAE